MPTTPDGRSSTRDLTHKGLWIKLLASAATLSYQDFAEKIQALRQSIRLISH